ncbi:MAG: hypothetical protein L6R42_005411, partial [Xanthoria sp. 1 TBL-2021]
MLAEKVLSKDSMFDFDGSWRGETSARRRGLCPAPQWTQKVYDLLNTLSVSLLEIAPLRLLTIAGPCPNKQYRDRQPKEAKRIELVLEPTLIIEFDLDFSSNGLR